MQKKKKPSPNKSEKRGRKSSDELTRLKKVAYELYMNGSDPTFKEIASIIGVNAHTVSDWAEKELWSELREAMYNTARTNVIALHSAIAKIHENAKTQNRTLTNDEADSISKLSSSIEKFSKKLTPSTMMESLMKFNDYLKVVDLELAKKFIPHMKDFVARELSIGK